MRKRGALDEMDLRILAQLDKSGGTATSQELHEELKDIPARTIRYRLSAMTERGVLLPPYVETHERRFGLGEGILVLQERPGSNHVLEELLDEIPIFFWYVPTNGKYDGYLVHMVHDITRPDMVDRITDEMKSSDFVERCHFFDIVDYRSKRVDFSHFEPDGSWSWDWDEWHREIRANLRKGKEARFGAEKQEVFDCDYSDILILRKLMEDATTSVTELSSITGLSIPEARDRVKRMRDIEVIRAFRAAYGLPGDYLWISLFFATHESGDGILPSLEELPFLGGILIEDNNSFCLRLGLPASDLKHFLDCFKALRDHVSDYFFQLHLTDIKESKYQRIFSLFDKDKKKWSVPVDEYVQTIRDWTEKSG